MTLPRGAAEVLESHVSLEVECLDRAYLNVYQPKLQFAGGLVQFLRGHRGNPITSTALVTRPKGSSLIFSGTRRITGWASWRSSGGNAKTTSPPNTGAAFEGTEGVYLIGPAQEKTRVFRTEKRRNPQTGKNVSVDRLGVGDPEPLLLLCGRRRRS